MSEIEILESRIQKILKDHRGRGITAERALGLIDGLTNKVPTFKDPHGKPRRRSFSEPLFFHEQATKDDDRALGRWGELILGKNQQGEK